MLDTLPLDPETLDPAALYRVDLARPVTAGAVRIRPRGVLTLSGAVLRTILEENGADAVLSAQPE